MSFAFPLTNNCAPLTAAYVSVAQQIFLNIHMMNRECFFNAMHIVKKCVHYKLLLQPCRNC